MGLEKYDAPVFRLRCDVGDCGITSFSRLTGTEALAEAIECGWTVAGFALHVCPIVDEPHRAGREDVARQKGPR